ncbi:nickel-dependent hydrogenase large subunit [Magnetospira thiophila]
MDEGRLHISLTLEGGRVAKVAVDVARPRLAGRLLTGRPADQAPRLMGMVFSICGKAQAGACARAVAAARGQTPDPATEAQRERHIRAEALDQDLLRLCLDWPTAMATETADAELRALRAAIAALTGEASQIDDLRRRLTRLSLGEDRQRLPDSLAEARLWWQGAPTAIAKALCEVERRDLAGFGHGDTAFLPALQPGDFERRLADPATADHFAAFPDWEGTPRETGALARHGDHPLVADIVTAFGRGLLARMVARLVGVLEAPGALLKPPGSQAGSVASGRGVGLAETARGLLAHRVELDGETVTGYRTVAPTEWNFHPDGPLARGLIGTACASPEDLRRRTGLLVSAIDPCVGFEVTVIG